MLKIRIRKGDTVIIISGNEKGKKGKVLKIFPKKEKVIVEKINFIKKHLKKGHPQAPQGGIIEKESPVNLSKVMLFCLKCNNPTRISHRELPGTRETGGGKRVRVCKKCNEIIDKV